jgi:hypothetical protein
MKHIAIDARELRTSTGRYVERLLHYLQQIDTSHRYTVLLKPKDMDGWTPTNPNFTKLACPYKEFTFSEQLGFYHQLEQHNPDLVHFPMVQQPVLYRGKVVTTMQDLTGIRFSNPTKNPVIYTIKQAVYKWVNKRVAHKSDELITPTEFVKQDVAAYTGVNPAKITVTYEAGLHLSARRMQCTPYTKGEWQHSTYLTWYLPTLSAMRSCAGCLSIRLYMYFHR